jgi:N6-L-threonylcarbamoyladenine synthase
LRSAFSEAAEKEGWQLHYPERRWCTDNATMIGYAAAQRLLRGETSPTSLDASPGLSFGVEPGARS